MAQETRKIYSNLFLKIVENALVTLGENQASGEATGVVFFNTNWEGEVSAQGATTVNIPVEGSDPTVKDYVIATGIAPELVDGNNLPVVISGDHAVNELLDGYQVATVPAKVVSRRLARAARAFAKKIDADAITTLEATTNTNTVTASTNKTAYANILSSVEKGMEAGVTFSAMIVTPKIYTLLKRDPEFTKPSDMGMKQAKNGLVGFVDGIAIVVANGLDAKTEAILVDPEHATRIVAWKIDPKLVSLDGSANYIGASAIKGRLIFKHQITNPAGVLLQNVA